MRHKSKANIDSVMLSDVEEIKEKKMGLQCSFFLTRCGKPIDDLDGHR